MLIVVVNRDNQTTVMMMFMAAIKRNLLSFLGEKTGILDPRCTSLLMAEVVDMALDGRVGKHGIELLVATLGRQL